MLRTIRRLALTVLSFAAISGIATAQTSSATLAPGEIDALRGRLELLERQNAEFQQQLRLLRQELDHRTPPAAPSDPAGAPESPSPEARLEVLEEKVELHAGRLIEHERVKMEGSNRTPVRLSGMLLFNAFANTQHSNGQDKPRVAQIASSPIGAGANLRQSVIGLEFQSPNAILGGQFRGGVFVDFFQGQDTAPNAAGIGLRLRTAWIEGQWKTRGFLVGQETPIFTPREPNSLARFGFTPLAASGNLYHWQPQIRLEQRLKVGSRQDLRARIGVVQTNEDTNSAVRGIPTQYAALFSRRRPGIEGHLQLTHRFDDFRRFEIASGFHRSTTHIAGVSVPTDVFSIDWFYNPHRRIELTGTLFRGQNLVKFAGVVQGFTFLDTRPGLLRIIPVRSRGGWAQITWLATSRLSFNLYSGEDDPNNRDLLTTGVARNFTYAGNVHYRVAPNVVVGMEFSQARTRYMSGQHPQINHYDLAVAYLF